MCSGDGLVGWRDRAGLQICTDGGPQMGGGAHGRHGPGLVPRLRFPREGWPWGNYMVVVDPEQRRFIAYLQGIQCNLSRIKNDRCAARWLPERHLWILVGLEHTNMRSSRPKAALGTRAPATAGIGHDLAVAAPRIPCRCHGPARPGGAGPCGTARQVRLCRLVASRCPGTDSGRSPTVDVPVSSNMKTRAPDRRLRRRAGRWSAGLSHTCSAATSR